MTYTCNPSTKGWRGQVDESFRQHRPIVVENLEAGNDICMGISRTLVPWKIFKNKYFTAKMSYFLLNEKLLLPPFPLPPSCCVQFGSLVL